MSRPLRGISYFLKKQPRGDWGVVEASLNGGLEGSLYILLGGILERVALKILGNGGKGCVSKIL